MTIHVVGRSAAFLQTPVFNKFACGLIVVPKVVAEPC